MRSQGSSMMQTQNNLETTSDQQNTISRNNQDTIWSKIQALKLRKFELEKLLNEKSLLLQQIQNQEAQIISGNINLEITSNIESGNASLRRKIGTSLKVPKYMINNKEFQQEISNVSLKTGNDSNLSKLTCHSHKTEYDTSSSQKALPIAQNLSINKKHQILATSTINPSSSSSSPTMHNYIAMTNSSLNKIALQQHNSGNTEFCIKQCNNDNSNNLVGVNKYGSNSSVNNLYKAERRNSVKSTVMHATTKMSEDFMERSIIKNHREDYDINHLVPAASKDISRMNNNSLSPSNYVGLLYKNFAQQQQQQNIEDLDKFNKMQNDISEGGYYSYSNNNNNNNNSNNNLNLKPANNSFIDKYYLLNQYDESGKQNTKEMYYLCDSNTGGEEQGLVGLLIEKNNMYSPHGGRLSKNQYDTVDTISLSPSTIDSLQDSQQSGLGGYWRALPNNERIWCTVENSYDNSNIQQQQRLKKNKAIALPIKASSLGNFDIITAKDEAVDQVSISSMNSESNKKPKEKQWLETSLDGPLIRNKIATNENISVSLPLYSFNSTNSNHKSTLSPTLNQYNVHLVRNHLHPHRYNHRERSRLSSHSMSNNSYHPVVTKLEDQIYLSHSTSVLNNDKYNEKILIMNETLDLHSNILNIPSNDFNSIKVPCSDISNQTYKAMKARSPILSNINKTSDIRVESPKNMTVIQPATFMPYKEVTKPFEMSDFYKYSTKFRQKEAKQQTIESSSLVSGDTK